VNDVRVDRLSNGHYAPNPNGDLVVVGREHYQWLVNRVEELADRCQVEVIYRGLAERRLKELEGGDEY
jgi:hypothetical protein